MSLDETLAFQSYETTDPDVRLMLRVRDDDDAEAFEELVQRYQVRLLTILQHLTSQRDQAEDLAQEVFMRVYRARTNYAPQAKFSTWLFTIANNVANNALRSQSRRKESALPGGESGPQQLEDLAPAPSGATPTRLLANAETNEMVRQAIRALNERQRIALLLSKFEHMSYAEIAETMDLSVQAVKSLLSRARDNLRTLLGPYMREGTRP